MNECKGLFGRLFGHKFEPVFNLTPPLTPGIRQAPAYAIVEIIEALTKSEYVHTCCTRCGLRLEKP